MNTTSNGYNFQMNFKSKKSGKKANKSHSSGVKTGTNNSNNSTMNKFNPNMPLNYFTLSVDNKNLEEMRMKDPM
jgi:hypothetical protein